MPSSKVPCKILRETEKALLIRQAERNREPVEAWIPRSVCEHISKGPENADGTRDATLTVADWLIEKHNLKSE